MINFASRELIMKIRLTALAILLPLAKNPRTQKVITAYVTSRWVSAYTEDDVAKSRVRDWLEAIAKAGSRKVEWAEQFALAAYQNEDVDLAERWLKLAHNSPTAIPRAARRSAPARSSCASGSWRTTASRRSSTPAK